MLIDGVTTVKRQHAPQRVVGDLLDVEISEKQARPIECQMTFASFRRRLTPLVAGAKRVGEKVPARAEQHGSECMKFLSRLLLVIAAVSLCGPSALAQSSVWRDADSASDIVSEGAGTADSAIPAAVLEEFYRHVLRHAPTRAEIARTTIPPHVDSIRTTGYAAVGDRGGALYRRVEVEPSHAGKVQSADSAWWEVVPDADGRIALETLGAVLDGATDATEAVNDAFASGFRLKDHGGTLLITDTILLDPGADYVGAGGVARYEDAKTRWHFEPSTQRDVFNWRTAPADYVFDGARLHGFTIRGFGAGASAVLDLPRVYNGDFNFFCYAGIDAWMRIGGWIDSRVRGGCQGFNDFGIEFYNPLGTEGGKTTTTSIDAYISQGPAAYIANDNAVVEAQIRGVVESVDTVLAQARGNVIYAQLYVENAPRTDTGAAFEVGKTGTSPWWATALHLDLESGSGWGGGTAESALLIDADHARLVRVSGYVTRYGALLATTANTSRVILAHLDVDNTPWLSLDDGIADMAAITAMGFRPFNMQTRGDSFYSTYDLAARDLELFPQPHTSATPRKLFVDSLNNNKLRRKDEAGNISLPIGILETTDLSAWSFNGGRLAAGELVAYGRSELGAPALWRSQRHSRDSVASVTGASTAAGNRIISAGGAAPFAAISVGDWVTASAGFPSTTQQYQVISKSSDSSKILLDTNASSTVLGSVTIATEAHRLVPVAQQGHRTNAGPPVGSVTPHYVGEEILDGTNAVWWKAGGATSADWRLLAPRVFTTSSIVDAPSIPAGSAWQTTLTVTGGLVGDWVDVSYDDASAGLLVGGRITAADTVTITFQNVSRGALDPLAATVRVLIINRWM